MLFFILLSSIPSCNHCKFLSLLTCLTLHISSKWCHTEQCFVRYFFHLAERAWLSLKNDNILENHFCSTVFKTPAMGTRNKHE